MTTPSAGSNITVLRALPNDGRCESMLAQVKGFEQPVLFRVLPPGAVADAGAFIARAKAFGSVAHASVLGPRQAAPLKDGRVSVIADFVDAPTLAERKTLPIDALVAAGVEVAKGLAAVHASGLSLGGLVPSDVLLSSPAKLDVTLAALRPGGDPKQDVAALATLLLEAGAAGADQGPFESAVRKSLASAPTAAELARALEDLQGRWQARTAVSGSHPARAAADTEPDLTGTTLGQYQLERIIGEGAMGRVYLGRHTRIGRQAAVKVLKTEHAVQADLVQRFIQEAQAVNAIKNEHIVEVYDFGEEPTGGPTPRVFCVMELLEGEVLADAMMPALFPVQRTARICQQLALALHAAHQVGVVHRDIKPENVFLVQRDGQADYVKVLDFGVAKLLKPIGDLPKSGTLAGVVIGTPEYMAPEQAMGMQTDYRVDIYAVGLVLYELLSGRQPFAGETFGRLVVEITTKPPPALPRRNSAGETIPLGLAQVVMKALAKDPEHRFETAEALAKALEPFEYSGRTVMDVAAAAVPSEEEALAAVKPSAWPRVAAALVVALVLAAGGYAVTRPAEAPALPPVGVVQPPPPPPVVEPVVEAPQVVRLQVVTTPAGAEVVRTDTMAVLGTTPLSVELPPLESLSLKLSKDGHEAVERQVGLLANASLSVDLPVMKKVPSASDVPKDPPKKKKKVSRDGIVDPFAQ